MPASMPLRRATVTLLLLAAATGWQNAVADPNAERGAALYENHCRECHESNVHIRNQSKVRSLEELRSQVTRWSVEVKQNWSQEEIADVTGFLNARYYQYPAE